MEMSTRMNRRDAVRWAKRAIHLPIGERWLIISVFAALLGPTWALGVLLAAGLRGPGLRHGRAHAAHPHLARTDARPRASCCCRGRGTPGRSWACSAPSSRHRRGSGGGPTGPPGRCRPCCGWLELGVVAVVALWWHPTVVVVAFWWMAVVAFHHYDTLYRAMQDSAPPRWLVWLGLGWEGRTVLVLVLAAVGAAALATGLAWGVGLLAALFVVVASVQWLSVQPKARA